MEFPINNIIQGDCLEVMQDIDDKSIDMILCDYKNGMSMRSIGTKNNTNHKKISRILYKNNIEIRKPRNVRMFRKCKNKTEVQYRNMQSHLRFNVDLSWLMQFDDFDKLKYLNRSISRKRDCEGFTTETYKVFIEKFYNDSEFNRLYREWKRTNNKWIKPSLDHIVAKSKGGRLSIDNLQFISWFENRAKMDIPQEQWYRMKENIDYYL